MANLKEKRKIQYLHMRISDGRKTALELLAEKQEKTITQIIDDAIDFYVLPQLKSVSK